MDKNDNDLSGLKPVKITVSPETYDWLIQELERPPKVNEKLAELLRKNRGIVRHE